MARKYQAEDLLPPKGRLPKAMFPGLDDDALREQIETWLDAGYIQGATASDVDGAALAWAYYLAYDFRAGQLAAMPNVTVPNEATRAYTDGQRGYFERQAEAFRAEFYGYLPAGDTNDSLIPPSGTSKTHFGWAGTIIS